MLIDSHCHLEYEAWSRIRTRCWSARARGGEGLPQHLDQAHEWDQVVGTAEREQDVWASVGIHPHQADDHEDLT